MEEQLAEKQKCMQSTKGKNEAYVQKDRVLIRLSLSPVKLLRNLFNEKNK